MIWKAHTVGAIASATAAALWIVLAWRTPTSTHHFAPMVAGGIWAYLTRRGSLPAPPVPDRLLMLGGGLAISLAAQLFLTTTGKLEGPPLLTPVPVPLELTLMALFGAVVASGVWCIWTQKPGRETVG